MIGYGEQFNEAFTMLGKIDPASYAAEQNTGWLDITPFERVAIIIQVGDIGAAQTVDADIEIATSSGGANVHTLKSITQLADAADDNNIVVINVRAEELSNPSGAGADEYTHLQLELTPSGASLCNAIVLGYLRRHVPVVAASDGLDEAVA